MLESPSGSGFLHLPERAVLRWDLDEDLTYLDDALDSLMPLIRYGEGGYVGNFFRGKSVLTLGCGSPQSSKVETGGRYDYLFEAWVPRLIWAYRPQHNIGIDFYAQDPFDADVYNHIQADIVQHALDGTLDSILPEGLRFDVIFARNFLEWDSYKEIHQVPSPTLARTIYGHFPLTQREKDEIPNRIDAVRRQILEQLTPRMNEGCLIRIDWPVLRYENSALTYLG